jgi:hypothetical protein
VCNLKYGQYKQNFRYPCLNARCREEFLFKLYSAWVKVDATSFVFCLEPVPVDLREVTQSLFSNCLTKYSYGWRFFEIKPSARRNMSCFWTLKGLSTNSSAPHAKREGLWWGEMRWHGCEHWGSVLHIRSGFSRDPDLTSQLRPDRTSGSYLVKYNSPFHYY